MKFPALLALLLSLATFGFGQQVAYSIHANSGLFRFGGQSATKSSGLVLGSGRPDINYTNNPYGKNVALSYGLAAQVQKVNPKNLIYGLQAGYEILQSKVYLQHAYTLVSSAPAPKASGETVFQHNFINAHPFLGKRFILNQITLDLSAGLDLGYCLQSHEKGKATDNSGQTFISDKDRAKPGLDTRPRLGITAYYHQVGLTAGYGHGLKNYTPQTEGANLENYARLIRFGLVYKI